MININFFLMKYYTVVVFTETLLWFLLSILGDALLSRSYLGRLNDVRYEV